MTIVTGFIAMSLTTRLLTGLLGGFSIIEKWYIRQLMSCRSVDPVESAMNRAKIQFASFRAGDCEIIAKLFGGLTGLALVAALISWLIV